MEQELASIFRFILNAAGNPAAYYHNIPESFEVPSVFFPSPEIGFVPETLNSYGAEYTLFVKFFHSTTENAYELALSVFHSINRARRKFPVYDETGRKTGEFLSVKELSLEKAAECAYQLCIGWTSCHPYGEDEAELARNFYLNGGKI